MSNHKARLGVMVAGIGGASLGTELLKCLRLAGRYDVFGCDVSATAYGHYDPGFSKTFCVKRDNYVDSVISACAAVGAKWLIPGGEQPTALLSAATPYLMDAGIRLVGNTAEVVRVFSDKQQTFERLAKHGIKMPRTAAITTAADIDTVGLPCIVKPATGTGGSFSVFYAVSEDEAMVYAEFIRRGGNTPLAQEYVGVDEGEFTIGVLSLSDGRVAGSIALKRALDAKLSVSYSGRGGIISSGYSQGLIDEFPEVCAQAESIASLIGSRGPINVQGRLKGGVLFPFEINPRFSASTYLRAMAGFNEVDILLRHLSFGEVPTRKAITTGLYLRSLTESFVPAEAILVP